MKNQIITFTGILLLCLVLTTGCAPKDTSTELLAQVEILVSYWNTGNFDGIEDVLCEDFEMRATPLFEAKRGVDVFKESVLNTRKAYPDFKLSIDEFFFAENVCGGRWTIHATSPEGKKLIIPGMSIIHFKEGKIKDEWISNNDLLWLKQLNYTIVPPESDSE